MLRPFGRRDAPAFGRFYRAHFPKEAAVLEVDAVAFEGMVRRITRVDARLILGLLRWLGRPLGDFRTVEVDGAAAGVAFVFYEPPAATLVNVVVDTPYRGRGLARRLVRDCEAFALRHRCRYAVLQVIEGNVAADRLYRSMGYTELRNSAWYTRPVGGSAPELPTPPAHAPRSEVRPMARADAPGLVVLATRLQSEAERRIRPMRPAAFRAAPPLVQALGGASQAFVWADPTGAPRGFLRVATSPAMGSGLLVGPFLDPALGDASAFALIDAGLAWFRETPVRRIVAEVPLDDAVLLRRLTARGFSRTLGLETLVHPIG